MQLNVQWKDKVIRPRVRIVDLIKGTLLYITNWNRSINTFFLIFISSHLISSHLISSHLISSHLISSHLISSHLISSHLISSHSNSSSSSVFFPFLLFCNIFQVSLLYLYINLFFNLLLFQLPLFSSRLPALFLVSCTLMGRHQGAAQDPLIHLINFFYCKKWAKMVIKNPC